MSDYDTGWRAGIAAAAKVVCKWCRMGVPLRRNLAGLLYHDRGTGMTLPCQAWEIHVLRPPLDKSEGDTPDAAPEPTRQETERG